MEEDFDCTTDELTEAAKQETHDKKAAACLSFLRIRRNGKGSK
jgi:hypothetical protein